MAVVAARGRDVSHHSQWTSFNLSLIFCLTLDSLIDKLHIYKHRCVVFNAVAAHHRILSGQLDKGGIPL
jgi:hypothetical protein